MQPPAHRHGPALDIPAEAGFLSAAVSVDILGLPRGHTSAQSGHAQSSSRPAVPGSRRGARTHGSHTDGHSGPDETDDTRRETRRDETDERASLGSTFVM